MYKIIDSSLQDLNAIAKCHQKAFPASLSSAMGVIYVKKMLEWYLVTPYAFIFHIEEQNECIGYCGGMIVDGTRAVGSASGMLQYSFNAAVKAMLLRPWLFLHPEFLKKYRFAWKNVRRRMNRLVGKKEIVMKPPVEDNQIYPYAGLVVIGVDSHVKGKGYGSILLQDFEKRAIQKGVKSLQLTVKANNTQAIKAYERNGWYKGELKGESLSMMKFVQ